MRSTTRFLSIKEWQPLHQSLPIRINFTNQNDKGLFFQMDAMTTKKSKIKYVIITLHHKGN
jgi:hypothetical protein